MEGITLLIISITSLVVGTVCAFIAKKINTDKGRSGTEGFLFGFFLGIVGIIIVALLPTTESSISQVKVRNDVNKTCPYCGETIKTEALVCRFCGREIPAGRTGSSPFTQFTDLPASFTPSKNSKYYLLQEIVIDSFNLDAPVEIEKGSLLLETQTRSVLLQLKLNLLGYSPREISSVWVSIKGVDEVGLSIEGLESISYTFKDIFLQNLSTFGVNNPIILDPRIRKVNVSIDKVVFTNSSVWKPSNNGIKVENQNFIASLQPSLLEQFKVDVSSWRQEQIKRAVYFPEQEYVYWQCTCGRPNSNDADTCNRCKLSKYEVFSKVNRESIQKNLQEELKRKQKEKELFKKRTVTASVVVSIIVFVVLFFTVALPFLRYSVAMSFYNNKKYDTAHSMFISLDDYRSAKEMANQAIYQKGVELFEQKQYSEAVNVLLTISDYENSVEIINEATYQQGLEFFVNKQFIQAINTFNIILTYKDAAELMEDAVKAQAEVDNEVTYQLALGFLANKQYDEAINTFNFIEDYKDATDLKNESVYQKALQLLNEKQFMEAYQLFSTILNYKDVTAIIENNPEFDLSATSLYQKGVEKFNQGHFNEALETFSTIKAMYRADEDTDQYVQKIVLINKFRSSIWELPGEKIQLTTRLQYNDEILDFEPTFDVHIWSFSFNVNNNKYTFDGNKLFNFTTKKYLNSTKISITELP